MGLDKLSKRSGKSEGEFITDGRQGRENKGDTMLPLHRDEDPIDLVKRSSPSRSLGRGDSECFLQEFYMFSLP